MLKENTIFLWFLEIVTIHYFYDKLYQFLNCKTFSSICNVKCLLFVIHFWYVDKVYYFSYTSQEYYVYVIGTYYLIV